MSLSLKLVLGEDIRKVHRLPTTYSELAATLSSFYGHSNFSVHYIDEEGDRITVSDTDSLQTLYMTAEGPSAKLLLTPHPEKHKQPQYGDLFNKLRESQELKALVQSCAATPSEDPTHGVACDHCGVCPITGVRYKCTVCTDFNLCTACEGTAQHPHPFVKMRFPDEGQWRCRLPRGRKGCFGGPAPARVPPFIRQIIKATEGTEWEDLVKNLAGGFKKPWKVKVIEHLTLPNKDIVPSNVPVTKIWRAKNAGKEDWPAGLTLEYYTGNIIPLNETVLPAVVAGGIVDIETSFLTQNEGRAKAEWKIQGAEKKFGKLKVNVVGVHIDPSQVEKVRQLVKLGFTVEQAKRGLERAAGDLEVAVSEIFKTFS